MTEAHRELEIWTIRRLPGETDVPGDHLYYAQAWVVSGDDLRISSRPTIYATTIDDARRGIPDGLYRIQRQPTDAAEIVESWL